MNHLARDCPDAKRGSLFAGRKPLVSYTCAAVKLPERSVFFPGGRPGEQPTKAAGNAAPKGQDGGLGVLKPDQQVAMFVIGRFSDDIRPAFFF
jgi:hypothetical protein